VYRATDAARGIGPLSDQNVAGGVMMVEEMIVTTILLGWLFYRFARQDEERQELLDLAAEHGIELSDERATRAARAGRTAALRERLLATAARQSSDRVDKGGGVGRAEEPVAIHEGAEGRGEPAGPDRPKVM
jgi:hypothetical protein